MVFVLERMSRQLVPLESVIVMSWEERIVLIEFGEGGMVGKVARQRMCCAVCIKL